MRQKPLYLMLMFVSMTVSAHAQSAGKIIERHINALGGKKALDSIVSTTITGTVTSADGRSGAFNQRSKRPNLLQVEMSWGDARWSTAFNGRSAWQRDTRDGLRTLIGRTAARVRADAFHTNDHFVTSTGERPVAVVGQDRVRGRPVVIVESSTPDGLERTVFFDADSYLIVKEAQQTAAGLEERFFDDYRRVDQVMEPHQIEWHRDGETFRITVERVTHNEAVDERVFDFIQAPADPPLNIVELLVAAGRNVAKLEERRGSYGFTETGKGVDQHSRFKNDEVVVFEVFHLGGKMVRKLVRKNGQELSEREKRREDDRVRTIVLEYKNRQTKEAERLAREGRSAPVADRPEPPPSADSWISAYLRMCDFSNPRREYVGGRALIVADFQVKPQVQPKDDFERQVSKMAGVFWIDEKAQQVIRTDSYFSGDYMKFVPGSSMMAEWAMVNQEVWLPSYSDMNLSVAGRVFGRLQQYQVTYQFSDYKKFSVDSDYQIKVPGSKP